MADVSLTAAFSTVPAAEAEEIGLAQEALIAESTVIRA